jgi:endonuclease/exonuclease/phosphatase family metal-dependent hydrolase
MADYRIISCNVRLQTHHDGEQQFNNRVGFLCERLTELDADIIGFQEITHLMRLELIKRMPNYTFVGGCRNRDRLGESATVAYKNERFMLERLTSDMLSPTPNVPGTTYGGDQSLCPRIFSCADLMPYDGSSPIRVINIHTDHVGKDARMLEVRQLIDTYLRDNSARPMPTVVTGDFNATPDAPEILYMAEHFTDLSADIGPTFHNYGRLTPGAKIDYVFASADIIPRGAFAPHDVRDGLYFSDHDPVVADISLI